MSTASEVPSIVIIVMDHNDGVDIPMLGICVLSQNGHQTVPTSSDFAVLNPSRPYEIASDSLHRMVVAAVAGELIGMPSKDVRHVARQPVSAGHVLGTASSLAAVSAARLAKDTPAVSTAQLPDAVLDLIAARLGELSMRSVADPLNADRSLLLRRIYRFIENNLEDPELSPRSIAVAHHFSLRYLQKLFQSQGTTVNARIRSRRLEKCRAELVDPRHQNRSIAAIGARWNLSPASYFSRVFREAYGISPREMRANAGWRDDGRSLRR
jgi:AraC-like DNA-binding protein